MTFKINDRVKWSSQAQSYWRLKVGTVVEVVPAGQEPVTKPKGAGFARRHESYIVEVPGKTPKAKAKLYWPVVSVLKPATASDMSGSKVA